MHWKTRAKIVDRLTENQRQCWGFLDQRKWAGDETWYGPTAIANCRLGTYGVSARASDACRRLVDLGLAERNERGQYRAK